MWYAGQLLGTTTLELASFGPGSRAGFLVPSEAFADIWAEIGPVFGEARDVMHALLNDPEHTAR